jgi:hypothetical protein
VRELADRLEEFAISQTRSRRISWVALVGASVGTSVGIGGLLGAILASRSPTPPNTGQAPIQDASPSATIGTSTIGTSSSMAPPHAARPIAKRPDAYVQKLAEEFRLLLRATPRDNARLVELAREILERQPSYPSALNWQLRAVLARAALIEGNSAQAEELLAPIADTMEDYESHTVWFLAALAGGDAVGAQQRLLWLEQHENCVYARRALELTRAANAVARRDPGYEALVDDAPRLIDPELFSSVVKSLLSRPPLRRT